MTLDGTERALDESELAALAASMRGTLITAGAPGYDAARALWNGMIDKRPAIIARCAGVADVLQCMQLARRHRLLLAVRGGGHNIAGLASCDGGMVIDLSPMRSVRVDPGARRAHVEGGALLADVDHETQAFGLATPLGINSTTGVAGLTLGGGFGWLTRRLGLTVDNLVSADVVTADARVVRASAKENPDLFWALRGGGGNFGIVTRFELQLHPIGPEVLAGLVVFPISEARSVLLGWRDMLPTMPDETSAWVVMRRAPPLPFLPPEVHGREVAVIALCHSGERAAGERIAESIAKLGTLVGMHVGMQPYAAWQRAFDPLLAPGARNYWKSHNFAAIPDAAIEIAIEATSTLPSPHCELFFGVVDGAPGRRPRDETAYAQRDARFVLNVHGRWETPEEDARCVAWARALFDRLTPFATGGVYVNFLTSDERARVAQAYPPDVWARLVAIKATWDPENVFRVNQNITPGTPPPRVAKGANGKGARPR